MCTCAWREAQTGDSASHGVGIESHMAHLADDSASQGCGLQPQARLEYVTAEKGACRAHPSPTLPAPLSRPLGCSHLTQYHPNTHCVFQHFPVFIFFPPGIHPILSVLLKLEIVAVLLLSWALVRRQSQQRACFPKGRTSVLILRLLHMVPVYDGSTS